MGERDFDDFVLMLGEIAALYQRDLSDGVIRLYWNALSPYDLAAVRQAFDRHARNVEAGMFMPKPADLIRMLEGSTKDRAFLAWAQVERAMRTVGGYQSVVFEDAITMRVIDDMGGWPRLCDTLVSELPFRARDFEVAYRGWVERSEVPAHAACLPGRHEIANGSQFAHFNGPPALIGDPVKCAAILASGRKNEQGLLPMALPVLAPPVKAIA